MNAPTFYSRTEAARILNERGLKVAASTLQKMATTGGGPRYQIFGNKAVYTDQDLEEWIAAKLSKPRRSTSEAAQ